LARPSTGSFDIERRGRTPRPWRVRVPYDAVIIEAREEKAVRTNRQMGDDGRG